MQWIDKCSSCLQCSRFIKNNFSLLLWTAMCLRVLILKVSPVSSVIWLLFNSIFYNFFMLFSFYGIEVNWLFAMDKMVKFYNLIISSGIYFSKFLFICNFLILMRFSISSGSFSSLLEEKLRSLKLMRLQIESGSYVRALLSICKEIRFFRLPILGLIVLTEVVRILIYYNFSSYPI